MFFNKSDTITSTITTGNAKAANGELQFATQRVAFWGVHMKPAHPHENYQL